MDYLEKDKAVFAANMSTDEPYTLGPDSLAQDGVPRGSISKHHWVSTTIYPGTERDYWLYVPQQYDRTQPACLMVFQDGDRYLSPQANAAIVFDNLIHRGEMPVTIGLFVAPGDSGPGNPIYGGTDNRSFEYDSLGDRYARFLIEELLPQIEREYRIVAAPSGRAICGLSSGGICAFTVAWERPDVFGKVVSHCGSFADMRGGYVYPTLIRKTEAKPIRVLPADRRTRPGHRRRQLAAWQPRCSGGTGVPGVRLSVCLRRRRTYPTARRCALSRHAALALALRTRVASAPQSP